MPIDSAKALALTLPPVTFDVERGRLRFFAQSIGEPNPLYTDVLAAVAAGHRDLPVPPTFFFSMELEAPEPFAFLSQLGVDMQWVLHGEQAFEYHALAFAGDTLKLSARLVDVTSKKGGALELLTKQTDITRDGELIARLANVLVVRNPGVGS